MTTMTAPRIQLSQQVIRFAGVGLVTTALHLGLFAALVRGGAGSQLANGIALVIATLANTGINRAWTFGISGRKRLAIHHGQALVIFAITYAATTLALALLGVVAPGASTMVQTASCSSPTSSRRRLASSPCAAGSSPSRRLRQPRSP